MSMKDGQRPSPQSKVRLLIIQSQKVRIYIIHNIMLDELYNDEDSM
jgi:hypothetical protein